jgi:hypothetical protein
MIVQVESALGAISAMLVSSRSAEPLYEPREPTLAGNLYNAAGVARV